MKHRWTSWVGLTALLGLALGLGAPAGGQGFLFPWGNYLPGPGARVGNVADETAKKQNPGWTIFAGYDDGYVYTAPVGSFDPNPFGVYDLAGNVWERCSSIYRSYPLQCERWQGKYIDKIDNNEMNVVQGSSWYDNPSASRAADRGRYGPARGGCNPGFRGAAARVLAPDAPEPGVHGRRDCAVRKEEDRPVPGS